MDGGFKFSEAFPPRCCVCSGISRFRMAREDDGQQVVMSIFRTCPHLWMSASRQKWFHEPLDGSEK